jgi:hypothetical protein
VPDRRQLGRQLAQIRADRRRLLGRAAILLELSQLDEQTLGRPRLASEERRHRRLQAELDALPDETEEIFR